MGASFLLRGDASKKALVRDKQEQVKRQEQFGKAWRFKLNPEESGSFIFVDGALDPEDGHLIPTRAYEHHLELGGRWGNFYVCPMLQQPEAGYTCPIHEGSKDQAAPKGSGFATLNSFLTVIDLRVYHNAKNNTDRLNGRRLFAMNASAFEIIDTYAVKRGGLIGWRVDVKRTSKNANSIGDVFDFIEKKTPEEWGAKYREPKLDATGNLIKGPDNKVVMQSMFRPLVYEDEIGFGPLVDLSEYEKKLRDLGFGKGGVPTQTGFESQGGGHPAVVEQGSTDETDYTEVF